MTKYVFGPDVQFDPVALNRMYQEAFGLKNNGSFVEVGAYDGYSYSHTWGLACIGWRGVYIEPIPELFALCAKNHANSPKVTMHRCVAGRHSQADCTIHVDPNCCCGSTLNPNVCKDDKPFVTQQRSLDNILAFEQIPYGFDLLSIDVEFAEMEVLAGFDLKRWMPRMIIIELCEKHDEPKHTWAAPARNYCEAEFPKLGYRKVYADMINTIFVSS